MGESFLTSWPKHSRIRLGRQERRGVGGQKMRETWHVKARDKGHLLVCLKGGRTRAVFPPNMPGKAVGESTADGLQYALLLFLTVDLGR